jgi:hypothetical protein
LGEQFLTRRRERRKRGKRILKCGSLCGLALERV